MIRQTFRASFLPTYGGSLNGESRMRRHRFVLAAIAALSPLAVQAQTSSGMPDMSEVHGTVGLPLWQVDWWGWFGPARYHHPAQGTPGTPGPSLRAQEFR